MATACSSWNMLSSAVQSNDCEVVSEILCRELDTKEDALEQAIRSLSSSVSKKTEHIREKTCSKAASPRDWTDFFENDSDCNGGLVQSPVWCREPSVASTCSPSSRRSFGRLGMCDEDEPTSPTYASSCTWDLGDTEQDLQGQIIEYFGSFKHPAFGNASVAVEVSVLDSFSGCWTIDGETMNIEIYQAGDLVIVSEIGGPTQFEGKVDADGNYAGIVVQDGERGGSVELCPEWNSPTDRILALLADGKDSSESAADLCFPRAPQVPIQRAAPFKSDFKPRARAQVSSSQRQDGVVIHVCDRNQREVLAVLPKAGLRTYGDVKRALQELFGAESVANIKFVMSMDSKTSHRESDLRRTGRLYITGYLAA